MKCVEIIEVNKMRVFLIKSRSGVFAEGDYNLEKGSLIVKAGAKVSKDVRDYKNLSAHKTIDARKNIVKDNVLMEDVEFKSASGAAVFVTGRSTNGLIAWKDENRCTLNEILSKGGHYLNK